MICKLLGHNWIVIVFRKGYGMLGDLSRANALMCSRCRIVKEVGSLATGKVELKPLEIPNKEATSDERKARKERPVAK